MNSEVATRRPAIWTVVALVACLSFAGHVWSERYFLRFIPLPLALADAVNNGTWILPDDQPAKPRGAVDMARFDMTTEAGLRNTMNAIQAFSPFPGGANQGIPDYADITFQKWVHEIQTKAFFCTDATQLFILAAWAQGLKAREWHVLPPGWPPGQGHSVAEFYNPRVGAWQLVDPQHASIVRDPESSQILNMVETLRRYAAKQPNRISYDYGPFEARMLAGVRGPATERVFFGQNYLATPVLQLRQTTWFADYARTFVISGHFVIGYPIVVDGWTHRNQVLWTKVSLLGLMIAGVVFLASAARWRRQRRDHSAAGGASPA